MTDVAAAAREQAMARRDRIRAGLLTLWDDVKEAWRCRDWLALGYATWEEMCEAEYPMALAIRREERPEIVADLRAEGMSTRAIAAATGVSNATISRDLSGVTDVTPEPVTGTDGKTYQTTRPNLTVVTDPEPVEVLPYDQWEARQETEPEPGDAHWSEEERQLADRLDAGHTIVVNMRQEVHGNLWEYAQQQGRAERVDRKSIWGNPFVIGDDGDRDRVCDLYATAYFPNKARLVEEVKDLKGMALGCWCAPARCHADHLAREADA